MPTREYSGQDGCLYISASGASIPLPAVTLMSWSLVVGYEDRPRKPSFSDVARVYVQSLPGVDGSFTGVCTDHDLLKAAMDSPSSTNVILFASAKVIASGPAWIDAHGSGAAVVGILMASGVWTINMEPDM